MDANVGSVEAKFLSLLPIVYDHSAGAMHTDEELVASMMCVGPTCLDAWDVENHEVAPGRKRDALFELTYGEAPPDVGDQGQPMDRHPSHLGGCRTRLRRGGG